MRCFSAMMAHNAETVGLYDDYAGAPPRGYVCSDRLSGTGVGGSLSYRPEYIDVVCRRNACNDNAVKTGQLSKAEFQACRKREADLMQAPWLEEIGEYTPKPIEFVELLRANICGEAVAPFDLRPHFRCRLDRVIFRDPKRNVDFKALAGYTDFFFRYGHDRGAPQGTSTPQANSDQENGAPRA